MVGSINEFERCIHCVASQSRDEKESVLTSLERLDGLTGKRAIIVGAPVIIANGTVVGAAQQGEFLVKTRFVIAPRNTEGDALCCDQVVESICGRAVLQHFKERCGEVSVELVSVDGFPRWRTGGVEQENTVQGDVSRRNKGPTNGSAFF